MTDRAVFSDTEWNLLVRLPRWVVLAASAAQPDRGRRSASEEEAGLIAVAQGRKSSNAFVATIAGLLVDSFDDPEAAPIDFGNAEAGIATVFERTESAARLLAAKADGADSVAYGEWLVTIADIVVGSARSGDVLGVGGDDVTDPERRFRDRLVSILTG